MDDWEKEYRAMRAEWREKPIAYAQQRLGLNPTWQQRDLLMALTEPGAKVTVRSGHGTGKSAGMACAIWWKLECFDYTKIPCTAPSAVQLRDILWAEVAKWMRRSFDQSRKWGLPKELYLSSFFELTQAKVAARCAPKEWFAVARTARPEQPDALQGFHASEITVSEDGKTLVAEGTETGHRGQIMFVIEEAGGVHDRIFEVAEGALSSPNASLLMGGNPTRTSGYFAASHKQNRAEYHPLHFKSSESPLVDASYRPGLVRKFGENSNVVRVRADGEFPRQDDDTLLSLERCEMAIMQPKAETIIEGDRRLGVDVARYGDDRTVFVLRNGWNVEHIKIEAKIDTMATVGMILRFIKEWKANSVHLDVSGGLGAGPFDRLREMQRQGKLSKEILLVPVNVSNKAPDRMNLETDHQPFRLRDYIWLECKDWIDSENASFCCEREHAEDLAGELASVRYAIDSGGRLVVEPKSDMKKRGLRSPDIADALNTTFFNAGVIGPGAAIFEIMRQAAEAKRKKDAESNRDTSISDSDSDSDSELGRARAA